MVVVIVVVVVMVAVPGRLVILNDFLSHFPFESLSCRLADTDVISQELIFTYYLSKNKNNFHFEAHDMGRKKVKNLTKKMKKGKI